MNEQKRVFQLGVIGTSKITKQLVETIQMVPELSLHSVYSRKIERAESFGRPYQAKKFYDNLDRFLADETMDAVYIASPNVLHYEQAKQALRAGKHVLLEKPASEHAKQFKELIQIAQEQQVYLMEAARHLYEPNFLLMKEKIQSLPSINGGFLAFGKYSSQADNYFAGKEPNVFTRKMAGGALMDLGVYLVHAAVAWFGLPQSVHYIPQIGPNGVDEQGVGVLRYESFDLTVYTSKVTNVNLPNEIYSGKLTLSCQHIAGIDEVILHTELGEQKLATQAIEYPMLPEVEHFAQLIQGKVDKSAYHSMLQHSFDVLTVMDSMRHQVDLYFPSEEKTTDREGAE
ncbi:Gfo/Idh/MocA family protein [Atopobacter phocae]|uniref:Gfo/Idh/MocA family protein n=1 Tax=Atopobacter phocae TaxID=136492 RepID=UPI0004B0EEAC|nr:Gfo/Idh/MocA family oxidoreductase [Atopobacter phocae]